LMAMRKGASDVSTWPTTSLLNLPCFAWMTIILHERIVESDHPHLFRQSSSLEEGEVCCYASGERSIFQMARCCKTLPTFKMLVSHRLAIPLLRLPPPPPTRTWSPGGHRAPYRGDPYFCAPDFFFHISTALSETAQLDELLS
jgi:hypothetical protein